MCQLRFVEHQSSLRGLLRLDLKQLTQKGARYHKYPTCKAFYFHSVSYGYPRNGTVNLASGLGINSAHRDQHCSESLGWNCQLCQAACYPGPFPSALMPGQPTYCTILPTWKGVCNYSQILAQSPQGFWSSSSSSLETRWRTMCVPVAPLGFRNGHKYGIKLRTSFLYTSFLAPGSRPLVDSCCLQNARGKSKILL